MKAAVLYAVVALGLTTLSLPGTAQAASYGLSGFVYTEVTNFPAGDIKRGEVFLDGDPLAASLQAVDRTARLGPGSEATARFLGQVGVLKAYASATYPRGGDGLATSTASGGFYDEIRVTGGGLAVGTPVSYRLDFSISGSVLGVQPDPTFGAFGTASVSLQDYITGKSVFMNWDNRRDATGIYSLTLNTVVGSSLLINASLQTGARVQGNSINARFAEADFYHSALYSLTPSVAGLNVVGLSGHDFTAAAVPEPASWALMGLGVGMVALFKRRRP